MNPDRYCLFVCNKQPIAEHPSGCCGLLAVEDILAIIDSHFVKGKPLKQCQISG